jgi:DNA transposition AAA+ family ATPase
LIIVDEADRLKMAGLEQMRYLYDHAAMGLIFKRAK